MEKMDVFGNIAKCFVCETKDNITRYEFNRSKIICKECDENINKSSILIQIENKNKYTKEVISQELEYYKKMLPYGKIPEDIEYTKGLIGLRERKLIKPEDMDDIQLERYNEHLAFSKRCHFKYEEKTPDTLDETLDEETKEIRTILLNRIKSKKLIA